MRKLPVIVAAIAILGAYRPSTCQALSQGPDAFGYSSVDSLELNGPSFSFIDIATTGTRLNFIDPDALPSVINNADDGVAINISLAALNNGFGFPFYGRYADIVNMSSNGFLHFQLNADSDSFNSQCSFPGTSPKDMIAVLWDDLVLSNPPSASSGGYVQSFSNCPYTQGGQDACVVFQWDNVDHFGGLVDSFDLQAILYANGNILLLFPSGNPEAGIGSLTGLRNAAGDTSLVHTCKTAGSIPADYAILFTAPALEKLSFESEPNEQLNFASPIPSGQCGYGKIGAAGDSDIWFISGQTAGTHLYTFTDTSSSALSTSTSLEVFSSSGAPLATDTNSGKGNASALSAVLVPEAGNVFLRVRELGDDAPINPYTLSAMTVQSADASAEIEPNQSAQNATPIRTSLVLGTIDPSDTDYFSFFAQAGDVLSVIVDNDPDADNLLSATVTQIIASDGNTIIASSDAGILSKSATTNRIRIATDGTYYVRVSPDSNSADNDYSILAIVSCHSACADMDGDIVCDGFDNCPATANSDQSNSDNDQAGDACDACIGDPAKLAPGACGCGIADTDANKNNVADCLLAAEVSARLKAQVKLLKKLTYVAANAPTSKKKADIKLRKSIATSNSSLVAYVKQVSSKIVLSKANTSTAKLHHSVSNSVKTLLKAGKYNFSKSKTAALKAISKMLSAL